MYETLSYQYFQLFLCIKISYPNWEIRFYFIDYEVITMQKFTIAEASQKLSDLIEKALKGEEIIIMKHNKHTVKLTPVLPVKIRPKFGSAKGIVTMADNFDEYYIPDF
jgi:prevent-host-death family protein